MILNGKAINPGDLRTKISLHERTVTTLDGGFTKAGTSKLGDVWSRWVNAHGSETWVIATNQFRSAATVLIRYRDDIDTTCVVEKSGLLFEIVSMDDIQNRHEYIELKVARWQPG